MTDGGSGDAYRAKLTQPQHIGTTFVPRPSESGFFFARLIGMMVLVSTGHPLN